jgi:biotin-(acetyl-CoA carboxylase) ligase
MFISEILSSTRSTLKSVITAKNGGKMAIGHIGGAGRGRIRDEYTSIRTEIIIVSVFNRLAG